MAMEGDLGRATALISRQSEKCAGGEVLGQVSNYNDLFTKGDVDERKKEYTTMVDSFYNLVTDFYEFGWGQSFHFAPRALLESFETSIARHEMWLAHKLNLAPGQHCLDAGCGVGGPMRCIARFSGAHVTGITINDYQIKRGQQINEQTSMSHLCNVRQGDFMKLPFQPETFDAAYQIEASVHAPDKVAFYKQIYKVLKPGGLFGGYEWCVTENYDENNEHHVAIKEGILAGNGLPDLELTTKVLSDLKEAGFEIVEEKDVAQEGEIPWWDSLSGSWSVKGFKHTRLGRYVTNRTVSLLEWLKIAPAGTTDVSTFLNKTADALVESGKDNIFTPCYFVLARKPLED
jgi:sterol 24-C-methyltransferase